MGPYIYKVNPKARVIAGIAVHCATYAFKPYGRSDMDDRLSRTTGCDRAEKAWAAIPRASINVVQLGTGGKLHEGSPVYVYPEGTCGVITDDGMDAKRVMGHFHKVNGRWTFVPAPEKQA